MIDSVATRVVVFGASGATGHELVRQALQLGYRVTAFVRNPSRLKISHPGLDRVTGDVADREAVSRAITPGTAVLIALGAKSPFARDARLVDGIRNITDMMVGNGSPRLIYLSFAGVHDSRHCLGHAFRLLLPLLSGLIRDHEEKERIIMESPLQWTIVRPALLSHGEHTGRFVAGEHMEGSLTKLRISRADVADFMLRQLKDTSFVRKAPVLMH